MYTKKGGFQSQSMSWTEWEDPLLSCRAVEQEEGPLLGHTRAGCVAITVHSRLEKETAILYTLTWK